MVEFSISNRWCTYSHDCKWPSKSVDMHHVVIRKSNGKIVFVFLSALIILANALYFFLVKEKSMSILPWSFLLSVILIRLMLWKSVVKESVVIIPGFGVQLETHYTSGRVVRHFIPIDKILKPVLVECVTPVTCYWSLSLILQGEAELMLVFKELRPPVMMLVPIWKALCVASGSQESLETFTEDGQPQS